MNLIKAILSLMIFATPLILAAQEKKMPAETSVSENVTSPSLVQNIGGKNISMISKEDYLAMNITERNAFKIGYLTMLQSGSCSHVCETYQGVGGTRECEISRCPPGTKPICRCVGEDSECGCETFGHGGISIKYSIRKALNGNVTLSLRRRGAKNAKAFSKSNLPNAKKIAALFDTEPIFKIGNKNNLRLTPNDFSKLENKFFILMRNYTFEEYFEVEYVY